MNFELVYASDGVVMRPGQMIMLDQALTIDTGHYRFRNVNIEGVQFDELDTKFVGKKEIKPGKKTETPRIEVVKCKQPEKIRQDFESLEPFETQDPYMPMEHMFRTFAQVYGLKTREELDISREANLEPVFSDEDPDLIESTFGLAVREEFEPEPEPDPIVEPPPEPEPPVEPDPPPA